MVENIDYQMQQRKDAQLATDVDILDELIHDFYDYTESFCQEKERYKLLVFLLVKILPMEPIGKTIRSEDDLVALSHYLGQEISNTKNFDKAISKAKEAREFIKAHFGFITYLSANYWSPQERGERRSIAFRSGMVEKSSDLANELAFYALSRQVIKPNLKSLVEFIHHHKIQKRGLFTCFPSSATTKELCKKCEETKAMDRQLERWLCIKQSLQNHLSKVLDIGSKIKEHKLDEISESVAISALNHILICKGSSTSGCECKTDDDTNNKIMDFVNDVIYSIESIVADSNDDLANELQSIRKHLIAFFSFEESYEDIDSSDAVILFMVVCHLMWQRTCVQQHNGYAYMFNTFVNDTCCVLTIGTEAPLSPIQEIALNKLANSLFIHPLLLDYKTTERQTQEIRYNQASARLLAHNFPKLLIAPANAQMEILKRELRDFDSPNSPVFFETKKRIEILHSIFLQYEKLFTLSLRRNPSENLFNKKVDNNPFEVRQIFTPLSGIVHLYREMAANVWLDNEAADLIDVDPKYNDDHIKSLQIVGHLDLLREMVINIVGNSLEQMSKDDLITDPKDWIEVLVSTEKQDESSNNIVIVVKDKAKGFKGLDAITKILDAIFETESVTHFANIVDMIEPKDKKLSEGAQGLGLIFCASYLQSLKWNKTFLRPGSIHIKNYPDGCDSNSFIGSEVKLAIPLVTTPQ